MKKYEPLGIYLAALPATQGRVTLTFREIETDIIRATLAKSARKHRQWWANQDYGSRAYHWQNAGFKVDTVDQKRGIVTFRRDGAARSRSAHKKAARPSYLVDPGIREVAEAIERRAPAYRFGELQSIRKDLKGLRRGARTIFRDETIFKSYAFHYGGRKELQFNIGFDQPDDGKKYLRHGVAISLERGPGLTEINDDILTRIARLSEFIEVHGDEYTEFLMYSAWDDDRAWSGDHTLRPVPAEIAQLGAFIFIGARQDLANVNVDAILRDFDRLLPMYEFVEGARALQMDRCEEPPPLMPGLTRKPVTAGMSVAARRLNKDLRHNIIQYALGEHLIEKYGKGSVCDELPTGNLTKIDLAVKDGEDYIYYEIKVAETAQHCIRQALGQLLEYSYWPGARRAKGLVIVGEPPCDAYARRYMKDLQKEFKLPVEYRQFNLDKKMLIANPASR
jgi:hypothetical protein